MYKQIFENKRGVIFDLDGTIVKTQELYNQAFEEIMKTVSPSVVVLHSKYHGLYIGDKWDTILTENDISTSLKVSELVKFTYEKFLEYFENSEPDVIDGFWPFLGELKEKEYALAVASNTDKWVVEKVLAKIGLTNALDVVLGGDEVKKRKPAPDIYNFSAKKLKLKASELIIFEDSMVGILSAAKSGIDTIAIWDGLFDTGLYPREVVDYTLTYEKYYGNLDETNKEVTKKALESKLMEKAEDPNSDLTPEQREKIKRELQKGLKL